MDFSLIPKAEASITTLIKSINKIIINPIIYFLFACALAYFLYGVAQYLMSPDNEEIRKKSKTQMVSGLVGLFIMVSVFGIMTLIGSTVKSNIKIQPNGTIVDTTFTESTTSGGLQSTNGGTQDTVYNHLDSTSGGSQDTSGGSQYTSGGYQYTNNNGGVIGEILLTIFNSEANKKDYIGTLVYPIQEERNWSAKPTQFTSKYILENNGGYYYVIGSGMSPNNRTAKDIAVTNALIKLARLKNITATTQVTYKIVDESNYTIDDVTGDYDYFVVLQSPKIDTNIKTNNIIDVSSKTIKGDTTIRR